MQRSALFVLGSVAYFAWFNFVVGLRPEHVGLYLTVTALYLASDATKRFVLAFSAFIIYWLIYDSMRVLPNDSFFSVHIAEPYDLEKALFGINTAEGRVTLNEYFKAHPSTTLDVMSGLFYLGWVPVPLLFAFWLFRNDKPLFVRFSYGFLFSNLIGFCIYYLYPAAPPWYVEQYGFDLQQVPLGNAAGLLKFDEFFGVSVFENMYKKAANVFAAIPSLHSAYPVLCLLFGRHLKSAWLNVGFLIFIAGVWFAAVYTRHHYLIDALAGGAVATAGYLLFRYLSEKTRVKYWLEGLVRRI